MSPKNRGAGFRQAGRGRKEAKAPPPKNSDIYDPEKFQEFIEILEICQAFVRSRSRVQVRLAIILLDNLAEVLMYYKCREILGYDDFIKQIVRPRYSQQDREKVERDFAGKVGFLSSKARLVSKHDATILRIGHSFRNAAFHRDEHNDEANKIIVRLEFEAACNLLCVAYGPGHISGGDESVVLWLRKYGIDQPYLEYGEASRQIISQLLDGVAVSKEEVGATLVHDLDERWNALVVNVLKELPLPELVLDEILKTEEFDSHFDYDSASESFREARRLIGEQKPFPPQEYFKREQELSIEVRKAYDLFTPTLIWRDILRMKMTIRGLRRHKSADGVFSRYEKVSDLLAKAEHLFDSAIRKNDAAAEMASEIARGK